MVLDFLTLSHSEWPKLNEVFSTLSATGLTWPRGYKTFFILNSAEHEIYPAHKC